MPNYQDIQATLHPFDEYKRFKPWYWIAKDDPLMAQLRLAFPDADGPLQTNRELSNQETIALGKVLIEFNKTYEKLYPFISLALRTGNYFYLVLGSLLYEIKAITLFAQLRKKFNGALLWNMETLAAHESLTERLASRLLTDNDFSNILFFLRSVLDKKIIAKLSSYPDLKKLNSSLYVLNIRNLSTAQNIDALMKCPAPQFVTVLYSMRSDLLDQNLFEAALPHSRLLANPRISMFIEHLPEHFSIKKEHLEHLLEICFQFKDNYLAGVDAIINYLNTQVESDFFTQFLRQRGRLPASLINDRQSTHTASVHISASQSALRLYSAYQTQLTPATTTVILNELCDWVLSFSNPDFKTAAAQRAVRDVLNNHPLYKYTDKTSQISNRELLCLAWLAIHDENSRQGSLEDAKRNLLEALYEIQRQNNINDEGIDNVLTVDDSCCPPGAFNKVLEKLQSIHPLVELLFVNKKTCSLKLRALVRQELSSLLMNHPQETLEEKKLFYSKLKHLEKKGCRALWKEIEPAVSQKFAEEFAKYFSGEEELSLVVNNGQYAICDDLIQPHIKTFTDQWTPQQLESQGFFAPVKKKRMTVPQANFKYGDCMPAFAN
ncbi:hypothetical protein [Legionella sp. 16cNR16C]|uniref:hypothetical protein n=1 Tax=Legionella sp. 16cNR16C TaxID=2905656 RepID=UPI001E354994|nr:hypothetical protein [Legionella sp. 16cNR16C]MCE3044479.1 hypothetical protein [Legionella sp. 16cNR16C]